MIKHFFTLLILTISILNISAQSSVFKVTGNGTTMYVGGTFHILQKTDYPLPKEFQQAYNQSDILVFETDISAMQKPSVAMDMMKKGMYTDGKSLETELSEETYQLLEDVCKESGIPIAMLNKMKPSLATMTLSVLKLQKLGFTEEGIDVFFNKKGKKDKKEILFFESVNEQIDILMNLGEGNEDEYVLHSLEDINELESKIKDLKTAWLKGDSKDMTIENDKMKKDYPSLYQSLLLDRNNNWLKDLNDMIQTKEIEFILVGALHLYGEDGILTLLKNEGCIVEQINF